MNNGTNVSKIKVCDPMEVMGQTEKKLTLTYPLLLTTCLIGNSANLIIYQHKLLRSSTTIRMLCAKAIANMVNTLLMFPNFLKSVPQWENDEEINEIYWQGLKYMIYIMNIFATFAIWITMLVSIERYVMVAFPVQAKIWCNMRNISITMVVIFMAAVGYQVQWFVARKIVKWPCTDNVTGNRTHFYLLYVPVKYKTLDTFYLYSNATFVILVPLVVMAVTTLLINYHLFWSSSTFANSAVEQKRCVTRLSLATTISHLIFETPHFAVFVLADIYKNDKVKMAELEWFFGTANFLSVVNNSIPFFIYLMCSKRYRQIAKVVLCNGSSASLGGNTNFTKGQENTVVNQCELSRSSYQGSDKGSKKKTKKRKGKSVATRVAILSSANNTTVVSVAPSEMTPLSRNSSGRLNNTVNVLINGDANGKRNSVVSVRSDDSVKNDISSPKNTTTEDTSFLDLSSRSTTEKSV